MSERGTNTSRVSTVKLALMARSAREKVGATLAADPIAIVGMGCRFPGGGDDPERFWSFLRESRTTVSPVPADRWDASKWHGDGPDAVGLSTAKGASFLDCVDMFDARYFGIPPREADQMDPQQRIFLEVAVQAMEDSGQRFEDLRRSRTGVFMASYHNDYAQMLYRDPAAMDQRTLTGTLHSVLVNRLSYIFDLRGPSVSIDTACSSSLVAVHLACQSLRTGESNMALAGGVSAILTPELMVSMSRLGFLAPDGRCKTFDARADGFGRGEGCGVIVLKRLSDALADGDRIWSVIRGSAVNQDGESTLLAAPNVQAQTSLIREAVATSRVDADDIVYIETHGTGTILGDPIEVEALTHAIGAQSASSPTCLLGGVKANIGHLEAAAGVAGIIKAALVLNKGEVPAQPDFDTLNPHINLDRTRFEIATRHQALPKTVGAALAGISSFGVGGTNAHVILEAAPDVTSAKAEKRVSDIWTLPLSARSTDALLQASANWQDLLASPTPSLTDLCFTAAEKRTHHTFRMAVSASSRSALAEKLAGQNGKTIEAPCPKICFVFCGQGPQQARMSLALAACEPVYARHLETCDTLIGKYADWSLLEELSRDAASSRLQETAIAQPALTALQTGLVALLKSWNLEPDTVIGHSVGEIAALQSAGILSLDDAIRVACHRGKIMQSADGTGAMASVLLDSAAASQAIASFGSALSIAAINAPGETVISGESAALDRLLEALKTQGVSQHRLPVRYAFHSEQMAPFEKRLVETVGTLASHKANGIRAISTITGEAVERVDAAHFARGIRAPVLFAKAMQATAADARTVYVEIGPHPVLSASIAASMEQAGAPDRPIVPTLRRGRSDRETMVECAARLYETGHSPNWSALLPSGGQIVSLPNYPWQRQRYWRDIDTSAPHQAGIDIGHPLLGHRLNLTTRNLVVFEGSQKRHSDWLLDHRIFGQAIAPATAVIELLAAAAEAICGQSARLEDFTQFAPLPLAQSDETPPRWQVIGQLNNAVWTLQLNLFAKDDDGSESKTIAEARFAADAPAAKPPMPPNRVLSDDPTFNKSARPIAASALISRFRDIGADFGASFQLLSNVKVTSSAATGRITLPAAFAGSAHMIHPTALDAGVQLCVVAAAGQASTTWLPVAARSFTVHKRSSSQVLEAEVHLVADGSADTLIADLSLRDPAGWLVAQVEGLRFAKATAATLASAVSTQVQLYTTSWQDAALEASSSTTPAQSWLVISDAPQGARLADALKTNAAETRLLDPGSGDVEMTAALDWLATAPEPRQVIDLTGLVRDVDPLEAVTRTLAHVQAVATHALSASFAVVTRGAFATGHDMSAPSIPGAAVQGFAATVSLEHPELTIRGIDLDPASEHSPETDMATALSAQLARKGPAKLALRGAACLSPLIKKVQPTDPSGYRAIRRQEAAGIDGLTAETLERSALSKGQVRIGVRSAGLNFRDVLSTIGMLEGERQKLGVECAGEVIEVASGVTAFKPGDRVFGYAPGALAEEVVVPVEWLELTPDHLTDDEASGLCVAFGTALYGLDHIAKLKPGERVLIHAGAGGVGLAAIQIALARGADVFTTAGSEQKRDMLRRLGVHHIFDSRTLEFEKQVSEATRGEGVDVVLNSLAGDFIPASVRTLSANGRFLELGKRDLLSPDAFLAVRPGASYHVYDLGRDIEAHPAILKPLLADILTGIEEEKLSPLPTHVFGLAHIADAMRFMASAKHIGKIILRVPPRSHVEIRPNATYWVTGGLGGLGLHTARWLVGKGARHIVLSGRRGPDASASAAIAQIEKAGATVRILVGDAGDSSSNAQILALIKNTMAPLRGIIHAAGSLRDGPVLTRQPADVESVFRGKLAGALSLDQSTRHLPLDFFILYSAAGTTLGAPGQSLYAAANAALDALAAKRVWAGYPASSIAWGRWSGVGMLAELAAGGRDVWAERGLGSITPESGFAQLEDMLRSGLPNAMAIAIDWRRFAAAAPQALDLSPFARFSKNHPNASAEPAGSLVQTLGEKLTIAPPGERHDKLQQCVETAARDIIGLPADTDIDPDQPLKDIGLDSLMAVEMRNELARAIGLRLTATLLFDYPTVNRLVEHLDVQLSPDRSEKPGDTVRQEDDLDSLSDKELAALLDEELAASAVRQNTRGEPPK